MKERILITGSTGFIGKFLVDEAISRGYEVYAGIRKTSNIKQFDLRLKTKDLRLVEIDFSDISKLTDVLKSIEPLHYIIHNAGLTKSISKEEYYKVNQHNTENFLQAIASSHIPNPLPPTPYSLLPTKFILISSLAAYGPAKKGEIITLKSKPAPLTHYGKSKLLAENAVTEQHIIPYLIIRPTAVYGPGEKDFFLSFKMIKNGLDCRMGSHEQQLTFIYVKDLVNAIFDLLKSQAINQSFFVSDDKVYDKLVMGKIVAGLLNKKVLRIAVPVSLVKFIAAVSTLYSKFINRKATALNLEKVKELIAENWVCDIQPLKDTIGFEAKYSLDSGLKETIEWYKENKWL